MQTIEGIGDASREVYAAFENAKTIEWKSKKWLITAIRVIYGECGVESHEYDLVECLPHQF